MMKNYIDAIKKHYPELLIQQVKVLTQSQNHLILVVNDTHIFRFPKVLANVELLKKEADYLEVLKNHLPFQIPEYEFSHFGEKLGEVFVGYPLIKGSPLTKERLAKLDKERIGKRLSEILRALHRPEIKTLMSGKVNHHEPLMYWKNMYKSMEKHLFPHMKEKGKKEVTAIFEGIFDLLSDESFVTCLVHGDFGPTNILVDEESSEITGIIDFSEVHIGDPAEDIAAMIGPYGYGVSFILDTFQRYPGVDKLVERALLYAKTFALQEALYGAENGDQEAFAAGMADYL